MVTLGVVLCSALPFVVAAFPMGTQLLVFVSPASPADSLMRTVQAAEGRLVASSRFEWVALVDGEGDDFAGRLKAAGAWLVLDGSFFQGCEAGATGAVTAKGLRET